MLRWRPHFTLDGKIKAVLRPVSVLIISQPECKKRHLDLVRGKLSVPGQSGAFRRGGLQRPVSEQGGTSAAAGLSSSYIYPDL